MKIHQGQWNIGLASDCGPLKTSNEDFGWFKITHNEAGEEAVLAIVADGMGGYQAGDVASRLAVKMIASWWEQQILHYLDQKEPFQKLYHELNKRFIEINEELLRVGVYREIQLGTTLSVIVLIHGRYVIAHVGDSRIYQGTRSRFFVKENDGTETLHEGSRLQQLTEDHSWVQTQVQLGRFTKEEARNHGKRNVLIQCLGIKKDVTPFQTTGRFQENDLFLLCSDGFHSLFSDREIGHLLNDAHKKHDSLEQVSGYLVHLAERSGAIDNITVLLLQGMATQKRSSALHKLKYWITRP
ncbi:MAG TPA: protein phosphatase 2C domain-containing protein [Bacillales bacterium]|nr:protein phosphatase 2C domain-containing protein [Bacillales bacterium]